MREVSLRHFSLQKNEEVYILSILSVKPRVDTGTSITCLFYIIFLVLSI